MTDDKNENQKLPRIRSPNYPAIDLKQAVIRAKELYQKIGRHTVGARTVAGAWGMSEKSSAFKLSLAAMRAFSLLENVPGGRDRMVRLTATALDIVADYPEGSGGYHSAIQRAGLSPGIYAEMRQRYGNALPPDDEVRRYLVRERGFNDRVVSDFIQDYKASMAFARLIESDENPSGESEGNRLEPDDKIRAYEVKQNPLLGGKPPSTGALSKQPGVKQDIFTLDEGEVVLQYPEKLSPESFQDFESWLQLIIRKAKRSIQSDEPKQA